MLRQVMKFYLVFVMGCVLLTTSTGQPHEHVFLPEHELLSRVFQMDGGALNMGELPKMTLVESIPVGDFALESMVPQTFDVLYQHVQEAKTFIDLSAMYWNLLGKDDRAVYSDAEMRAFGADRGKKLLQALHDAAARGVQLRILTSSEPLASTEQARSISSELPEELQELVNAYPQQIQVHCWSGPEWYGGGILHQKIWLFDRKHVYVGSANMDWKSLAQVMEIGVMIENLPSQSPILADIQALFDVWWLWGSPTFVERLPPNSNTQTYFSVRFQSELKVPVWSLYLPEQSRAPDPFVEAGLQAKGNISNQLYGQFQEQMAQLFIAAAPLEATAAHSRTFDEDALVYTIRTAKSRVNLSVMDFTPYSMYSLDTHHAPIWWPALTDAILAGVFGKQGLHVLLLISEWEHTNKQMQPALRLLQEQAELCQAMRSNCTGRLEIKIFRVPGWQNTTSMATTKAKWPSFTRVNHAKYVVTDSRVNIGTSNMEWGYFYTTAGASVNTDYEPLRKTLENVFQRNWNSSYAQPLQSIH